MTRKSVIYSIERKEFDTGSSLRDPIFSKDESIERWKNRFPLFLKVACIAYDELSL